MVHYHLSWFVLQPFLTESLSPSARSWWCWWRSSAGWRPAGHRWRSRRAADTWREWKQADLGADSPPHLGVWALWMNVQITLSMEYKLQQINSVSICLPLLSSMNWWKQNYASIHICICRVSVDSNACIDHLWWVSWTVCSRLLSCTPACPGNPSLCERYWLCVRSRQPCSLERTAPYEHLLPPAKYY